MVFHLNFDSPSSPFISISLLVNKSIIIDIFSEETFFKSVKYSNKTYTKMKFFYFYKSS
jgi:hypothetical protein